MAEIADDLWCDGVHMLKFPTCNPPASLICMLLIFRLLKITNLWFSLIIDL